MIADKDIEIFLAHHGVKGMHWGFKNIRNTFTTPQERARNKSSHEERLKVQRAKVDGARYRVKSGEVKRDYKIAKANHATNQVDLGKRKADQILNAAKKQRVKDINTSRQARDGADLAKKVVLYTAGYMILQAGVKTVLRRALTNM